MGGVKDLMEFVVSSVWQKLMTLLLHRQALHQQIYASWTTVGSGRGRAAEGLLVVLSWYSILTREVAAEHVGSQDSSADPRQSRSEVLVEEVCEEHVVSEEKELLPWLGGPWLEFRCAGGYDRSSTTHLAGLA
jgi:hypothetical protein